MSGEDYFTYVRRHLFEPAGMRDTDAYELDHDTPNLATGYTRAPDDPAGAFTNNLSNALRSGKLIDREHLTLITSRRVDDPGGAYGYGFDASTVRGHATFGHNGGFPGISTSLTVIPDLGVTIAVLANLDPPAADRVDAKARDLVTQR